MKKIVLITAAFLMLLPLSVLAQRDEYLPLRMGSISFRIGGFFPSGNSDIWVIDVEATALRPRSWGNIKTLFR